MHAPQDQFVDVVGEKIFARMIPRSTPGPATAATVVMLHDGLGSVAAWKDFPEQLADVTGGAVVAYDRPGHGRSPFPHDGKLDLDREASVILPALLEALGVSHPVLFGHSDGGTIALLAAPRVEAQAVIVEAAHVVMEGVMRAGIAQLTADWRAGSLRRKLSRYHGPEVARMFKRWASTWLSHEFYHWSVVGHLREVSARVLAVQGAADAFGTPVQLGLIAQHCSGSVRAELIPDCGHVPHHEKPAQVLALIHAELKAPATAPATPSRGHV
jgi:pimeloyl-ACP methyl ester carboxylesterase